jgi:CelD/BcsL family acetyltransferase involved in cellulose biosynthesis
MNPSGGALDMAAAPRSPQADVSCTVHRSVAELPADAAQLLATAGQDDFQASAAWFENFTRTVNLAPAVPEFHVWRAGQQARLVLPLLIERGRGGCSVTALGNYYTTRFAPACAKDLDTAQRAAGLDEILTSLFRNEAGLHTIRLGPLEAGSPDEALLRAALRRQGCAVFDLHAFQNWQLPVATDWPGYLATRDGKLRTTLSRMGRRFASRGGRVTLAHGPAGLEDAIAAYETVYAASWKQPEPHAGFMPGLIRAAAGLGQLRMAIAWLQGQPVAAQVWMVAGGRADIYKLAHDEAHKETSPGSLLTALLMQHVFEVDGVTVVDYLSGDDGYKRLWMSQVRERRSLLAYKLSSARGLALAARAAAAGLVKSVLPRRPAT